MSAAESPRLAPAPAAPAGVSERAPGALALPGEETLTIQAEGPSRVTFTALPVGVPEDPGAGGQTVVKRPDVPISEAEMERLRELALQLPPDEEIQTAVRGTFNLVPGVSFASLDYVTGGTGSTPPDPELAAGPDHLIAVVNRSLEIYDKSGTSLGGPVTLATFFAGTPGYPGGPFDPNVLYDESADRFMVGTDAAGTDYCFAVTATSDPTGTWNRYCFATDVAGAFFDYPHAGVGWDAFYMGSNQFAGPFLEGRVWAIDKVAAYAGGTVTTVTRSTGDDSTPQPANFHGASDGSFPTSGPHWILTEVYDACNHTVWTWTDPFGANTFTRGANLDLCAATGVAAGQPVAVPQLGGSTITANDFRGLDNEYRNGALWTTQTVSCNPGGGTVNCIRWAQIDPVANTVLDSGVFASSGDFRFFPDLAANACDDMVVGYTTGASSIWPEIWVAGREGGDPAGLLQGELLMKLGEETFDCFDAPPRRWGDYTGMTIDPDGVGFWYLGEYSKDMAGSPSCDWGTYIGRFDFPACSPSEIFSDGFESGDLSAWSANFP